jgi:hypothetical protein
MPALTSFTRLLQVLPAGSPACTHIYRLCSSGGASQQPATPPVSSSAGNATATVTAAAASSASSRTSPASLELGLNFATMDFDAVAKATHAAIARERGVGAAAPLTSQQDQELEAKLERQSEQSLSQLSSPPPSSLSPVPQTSLNTSFGGGAAAAAAAAYCNTTQPASGSGSAGTARASGNSRQLRKESANGSARNGSNNNNNVRYSLHDLLKDSLVERDWSKAFHLFTNAVNQSCRQVLIPAGRGGSGISSSSVAATTGAVQTSSTANGQADAARQAECFAALRKMLAALPPTSAQSRPGSPTHRVNVKNLRGITRWNGQHYYLLWKCLLEAGRVEEVQQVWSVMQQIGFAEYHMEEKTVNALMALLRRTSRVAEQATTRMVSSAFDNTDNYDERVEREREVRRQLVKDLEQVAAARQLHLVGSNRRTAENIRIAEALQRVEEGEDGEAEVDAVGTLCTAPADAEESDIAVGDFDGLLRRSRSMASTQRVLQMMAKLHLERGSSTFASLIASLHNPQYVLEGHTAEELASHQAIGSPTSSHPVEDASSVAAAVGTGAASIDTKAQYEAYKQERVETALRWFFECPKARRNADVYNELLYLLRAKSHWKDFDQALVQFRGNAVVSETEWPEVTPVRDSGTVASPVPEPAVADTDASAGVEDAVYPGPRPPMPAVSAVILAPLWTTLPNGKTYELLIQRARYVHQWDVMWALYEEMVSGRVRGTTRLYEVLLTEAHRHPPQVLHGVEVMTGSGSGAGRTRESSEVLLRLYDELRRNGGDVHSLQSTLNVVNAWSASRPKTNRWE